RTLMQIEITSTSNPKIKWLKSLHNNANRKKEGVFLVEGAKEIAMALDGGLQVHSFYICPDIAGEANDVSNEQTHTISKSCFEKVSYRTGSDGVIAVFHSVTKNIDGLTFGENPFFIIVESIEKPGNLGAI